MAMDRHVSKLILLELERALKVKDDEIESLSRELAEAKLALEKHHQIPKS